jgi:hypothetical protein
MKYFFFNILTLVMLSVFTGCGDDGTNGLDGLKGADGTNGKDAKDGFGSEDQLKGGSITLIYSGSLYSGTQFKDTVVFAYTSLYEPRASYLLSSDGGDLLTFSTTRHDAPGGVNSTSLTLAWNDAENKSMNLDMTAEFYWITADRKYKPIDVRNHSDAGAKVTDYSYTASTGKLNYKFETTVPGADNSTTHDLKITGIVDAVAYEEWGGE